MPLLLGVDVGTTGTKAILSDEKGNILASAYKGYTVHVEQNLYAEQDPEDWWSAVVHTIRECIKGLMDRKERIKAIALSTQGGSLVPVDSKGIPLTRSILWMDQRGEKQSRELGTSRRQDYFYLKTGWRLSNGLNLVQIKWLKDQRPELFNSTYKFISTMEYINFKLTGLFCLDYTNAAMTQMFNITERKWDKDILDLIGIGQDRLGFLAESGETIGTLSPKAASDLGLPTHVKVVSGGHDQYCVALGAGAVNSGDVLLSTGTAWVLLGISDSAIFDTQAYFSPGNHVVRDRWGQLASIPTGGASLEWFRDNLGVRAYKNNGELKVESFSDIDQKVAKKGPGAGGLMFYPHFTGSTCPTWSLKNRGTILGLDLSHDRYNIARALMEGVGFEVNWILQALKKKGAQVTNLKVVGGAARSRLWMQVLSDITGLMVVTPQMVDAACIGAVVLAGIGSGLFKDAYEGYANFIKEGKRFAPDAKSHDVYLNLYELYRKRFKFLKAIYQL